MLLIQETFIIMKLKREYKEGQVIRYINPFTKEEDVGEIFQVWKWKAPNDVLFELEYYLDNYFKRNEDMYVVTCSKLDENGIKMCCEVQDDYIIKVINETEERI